MSVSLAYHGIIKHRATQRSRVAAVHMRVSGHGFASATRWANKHNPQEKLSLENVVSVSMFRFRDGLKTC